jgi:hypothetical protein
MATMATGDGHSALRQTTAAHEIGCGAHPALSKLYTRRTKKRYIVVAVQPEFNLKQQSFVSAFIISDFES